MNAMRPTSDCVDVRMGSRMHNRPADRAKGCTHDRADASMGNRADGVVMVPGCPLAVHRWGNPQARVAVLLHGFMQSGSSWEPMAKRLVGAGWQVWAPDFAGHGESIAVPASAYPFVAHVDAVQAIARKAARSGAKPVVWGYSMGGRVAAAFACAHPDAAAAVVAESAGLGPRSESERQGRACKNAALAAQLRGAAGRLRGVPTQAHGTVEQESRIVPEAALDAEPGSARAQPDDRFVAFVDAWEALPLFASQRSLPADVRAAVRQERLDNQPEALALSLERAGQQCMPNLRPALGRLRVPALFMAGSLDVRYSGEVRALAAELADRPGASSAQRAHFAIVERAGHNIHLEQPDAALEEVMTFLQREGIA